MAWIKVIKKSDAEGRLRESYNKLAAPWGGVDNILKIHSLNPAIMIASALSAEVVAVDIFDDKLEISRSIGADFIVNSETDNPIDAMREITRGGANVSIEDHGHPEACFNSFRLCGNKENIFRLVSLIEN